MPRLAVLLIAPLPLLVGGCCCCNPFAMVPDDLVESAVTEGARFGVEQMTGVRIDGETGRYTVTTPEGRFMIAEGAAALDPRVPVAPYPACPLSGGLMAEDKASVATGFVQAECTATTQELGEHFERQIRALGVEPKRAEISQGGPVGIHLVAEGDGARFRTIAVMIQELDTTPRTATAVVNVNLDRGP